MKQKAGCIGLKHIICVAVLFYNRVPAEIISFKNRPLEIVSIAWTSK